MAVLLSGLALRLHEAKGDLPAPSSNESKTTPPLSAQLKQAAPALPAISTPLDTEEEVDRLYRLGDWKRLASALADWAGKDPEAAICWSSRLPQDHSQVAIRAIMCGWMQADPYKAARWFIAHEPSCAYNTDLAQLIADSGSWELTLELLTTTRIGTNPSNNAQAILKPWAERNYRELMMRIDTLPNLEEQAVAAAMVTGAMAKEDPASALAWINGYASMHDLGRGLALELIVSATTPENRAQIDSWLDQAQTSPEFLKAYQAMVVANAETDPERSYHWLQKIIETGTPTYGISYICYQSTLSSPRLIAVYETTPDAGARDFLITNVVKRWARQSPGEAMQYVLQSKTLSEAGRARAIQAVNKIINDAPLAQAPR